MTNPTPHGQVPAIQRYKIGYHSDEWGMRSSTPSGIPDASGSWVRYADHVAALAAGQATKAAPAGWKLVPVAATRSMMAAAVIFANGNAVYKNVSATALEIEESIYGEAYSAMLAASPTPTAEQQATKETSGGFHVWRDISTAPKDGSRFVAIGYNYGLYSEGRHTCVAQWFRGCWMETSDWNEASELQHLTHWLPLPSPPDNAAELNDLDVSVSPQQAAPKAAPGEPFQNRVQPWLVQCFGAEIAADTVERNHRFLEEALELVQSTGCTQSEAHQLVDYVFGRPVGEPAQEVGGVMVTLAALCLANGLDMHNAGEIELARIWTKVEAIRAKQAAKPEHSPLPQAAPGEPDPTDIIAGALQISRGHAIEMMREALEAAPQQEAQQSLTPETGNSVSAKGAAITSESGKPPAEQQARWVERWHGSGGKEFWEGWSILNAANREMIAHLGPDVDPDAVRGIVAAHNEALCGECAGTGGRWCPACAGATPPAEQQAAPKAAPGDAIDEAMRERDDAEDFIDALLDEVLGHERPEWSNLYGRADALNDVQERMTALHKPAVDKAWGQFQSAMAAPQQEAQEPVAWLNPWRADQVTTDYDAYGERGIPLYTAPQPAPAPLSDDVVKDAARYRWLRATTNYVTSNGERIDVRNMPEKWDAAIDAALAAQGDKA